MTIAASPAQRVHIRIRPWRGDAATAECMASPIGSIVTPDLVADALERARAHGFERVVTPAMPPYEWRPYLEAGLEIREHLHLFGHDLTDLPDLPPVRLRRARRRDLATIIEVDHGAFGEFWRLDARALREAARATATSRTRVATDGGRIVGYALYGRSGQRGYLQRLAVRPDAEGRGIGTALVVDGLRWLRRRRAHEVLVNTQESNERAAALYGHLGFRTRPGGLAVLQAELRSS